MMAMIVIFGAKFCSERCLASSWVEAGGTRLSVVAEAAAHHVAEIAVLSRLAQAGVHHRRTLSKLPTTRSHGAAAAYRRLRLPRAPSEWTPQARQGDADVDVDVTDRRHQEQRWQLHRLTDWLTQSHPTTCSCRWPDASISPSTLGTCSHPLPSFPSSFSLYVYFHILHFYVSFFQNPAKGVWVLWDLSVGSGLNAPCQRLLWDILLGLKKRTLETGVEKVENNILHPELPRGAETFPLTFMVEHLLRGFFGI